MSAPSIGLDEHVFVAGKTGSGKTYLAENYLAFHPRVAKLDIKGEALLKLAKKQNPWPQVPPKDLTIVQSIHDIQHVQTKHFIYCPQHSELNNETYNEFFRWCYEQSDLTVWVDEVMGVTRTSGAPLPEYYHAILTRGRFKNVVTWNCTQRPISINPLIMSQCTHFFEFTLVLDQDRKKMIDSTGMPEFGDNPKKYQFWYYREGDDYPIKAQLVKK